MRRARSRSFWSVSRIEAWFHEPVTPSRVDWTRSASCEALQRPLGLDDPGAGADARPRLDRLERRDEEVVGSPVDAVEEVLLAAVVDEEKHVGGRQVGMQPQPAADVDPEHALHPPRQDGDDRHALRLELRPRIHAVARRGHFVAPLAQPALELAQPVRIAVGEENPHRCLRES